jgi:tRNA threonylcarbamoyladenosine biosynthesis protein TsaE
MNKEFITNSSKETQQLGELLALELRGGEILCLDGELGAGKTTFTQGLLKGLGAKGPYTSPTFLIMKEYEAKISKSKIQKVYHIDAYRIETQDLLNLGWEEIIVDPKNIIIVEWSARINKILPEQAVKIRFEWLDEKQRKISFGK